MDSSIKADIPASDQGLGSFRETSTSSPPYTTVLGDPPLDKLDARGPIHTEFKGREPWHSGDSYRYPVPKKGDPWEHCHTLVQRYDGGMHDAWKDEIDKLLIFAGLFSATVTAFTIESYQWLKEGSSDTTARLLAEIVIQLKQLLPDRNDTMVTISDSCSAPFVLSSTVVRINIFWFLSLTLSLSTVLVGILCMQWLREYHRDTALPHKDAIALRQMRYEGFLKWKVPAILSSLPLLLQSAVILFFAGLLELLWMLNKIVAASVTVAVSVAVLFLAVTTAAPFLQFVLLGERDFQAGQCAYKSPQSWAFYRLGLCTLWLMTRDVNPTSWIKWSAFSLVKLRRSLHDQSWLEYDINQWRRLRNADDLVKGLAWIDRSFTRSLDAVYSLYHCLQDIHIPIAAQVVSELNPDVTVTQRLQQVVEDPVMQIAYKKDNVIASFLEMHRRTHPSLGSFYLETIVRLSNTQDTVRPFMDWPVRDLLTFPNDIIEQFLMCIKAMIAHEHLTAPNVITVWALIQRIVGQLTDGPDDVEPHIDLGFAIIEQFEAWLTRSTPQLEHNDRVALCVYGMVKVFTPSFDFHLWRTRYSGIEKAVSLVKVLDECLVKMGGGAVVLTRFVNLRWEELVARCSM